MYDDAACTTQSSDQAWATSLEGYLTDDTYAVAYSCHKDGVLTSMKADSEYKPGEQIAITLWDTCSSADVYNYKISTSATYGGDDKVGPCDINDDFTISVFTDADCKEESTEYTSEMAKATMPENDSAGWYTMFCTDETFTDKRMDPPAVFEWGKCTEHPMAPGVYLIYEASNKLMNVAASAMAAAAVFYLY